MSVGDWAFGVAEAVDEDVQGPLGGDTGVKLPDGAGGGVPRVDVKRFSGFLPLPVKLFKAAEGHVDLSAYLEEAGAIGGHGQGYGMDGTKILGYVLAAEAVSPGRAPDQKAVFVGEGHGETIKFKLADQVIARFFQ